MSAAVVLTVDELRALGRVLDLALPRFVTAGDPRDLRVDAAALRGLAARDLADLADGVSPAPALARQLAPCRAASLIAEVEVEADGRAADHAVVAAEGPAALFTDQGGGLVRLHLAGTDHHEVVRDLCRLAALGSRAGGEEFTVDADALGDAEDRLLAGDPDGAVAALVAGGAPVAGARAWGAAVHGRRYAVAVRAARNRGNGPAGPFEAAELRWVVAGDGTAWRVGAAPADRPGAPLPAGGWADEEPTPRALVGPVPAAELEAALRAVTTGERADAAR